MKYFVKSQAPDKTTSLVGKKPDPHFADSRLHTSLHDLIALRTHAHGFSLNPASVIKNQFIGRHASKHRGRGLNFEELAHYQHGDDIRTMDWKVTNRTGRPHVRVFTEERERPLMLACDQRLNMLFGSQHKIKSVVASEVLALLAWRQLALSDAIATLLFNDEDIFESRPHRSQQMLLKDLGVLVELNKALLSGEQMPSLQGREKIGLSLVLDRLLRLCPRNYIVVLISDFHDFDKHTNQQIKSLALNNDVFVALVADPVEWELPVGKQIVASNGRQQLSIDTDDTALTEPFKQHQQQRIERIRTDLNRAGALLMELDTVTESYQQLRRSITQNASLNANGQQGNRVENG
ncbi:MAG: DUF58 domain-containing protein [Pseudomonadales bacterium]